MRLAVTRLNLSRFRSHRRVDLDLDGRPIALSGPNGAGKTNLIEAVSLLSPGRGLRRAGASDLARRPDPIGWRVGAVIEGPFGTFEVDTRADPGQSRSTRINDKTAPQIALAQIARIVWLTPSMDRLWIEGAEGRRRFLDRIALSFRPDHAEAALDYEKAMRDRNRLLRDQVRDPRWFEALEHRMAEAGARLTTGRRAAITRLQAAQTMAETAFPSAELTLVPATDMPLPETAHDLRTAFADARAGDLRAGRTRLGPHRCDLAAVFSPKGVTAAQCSTGEQKAILISMILANARALAADTGAAPILLLDEVAAHLDATRRAALYDELCALGSQAWLTGTGEELFTDLGPRAQHLDVQDVAGESRVTTTLS